jgi:nuclear transport factor 2 (NTF2) superfamily protein
VSFHENRLAVRFVSEWHDDIGQWFRSYGTETWEFDENGLMRLRIASLDDLPISKDERRYHWSVGRRPDDYPIIERVRLDIGNTFRLERVDTPARFYRRPV